jgi:2-polyprenyl-3-methyl-5-hydroxy-6-metoxy-1,4-benzoquinol methylase
MGRVSFENFGSLATSDLSWTEMAGRYRFQESMEPRVAEDVAKKLRLSEQDSLLEIGCGAGNLLIPLARLVKTAAGIDHPRLLEKLAQRCSSVRLIADNFLDIAPPERFNKILIYSVLHYLSNEDELTQFVLKAARLLSRDGLLLAGDIPNLEKKKAFESDPRNHEFMKSWREKTADCRVTFRPDSSMIRIDEAMLVRLCSRLSSEGFDATRLAQPEGLPMCKTREDIVVSPRV